MILGFKTQNNGKPTGFVEKIQAGTKIHTLREDLNRRWKEGVHIEFATGVRTKQYEQFMNGTCRSTQSVFMSIEDGRLNVSVDRNYLYPAELTEFAKNDGFDTLEDFKNWFRPLVEQAERKGFMGINLRLIHWTTKRY